MSHKHKVFYGAITIAIIVAAVGTAMAFGLIKNRAPEEYYAPAPVATTTDTSVTADANTTVVTPTASQDTTPKPW